ncbi:unnamed protein product, partial [Mycena citricolor]
MNHAFHPSKIRTTPISWDHPMLFKSRLAIACQLNRIQRLQRVGGRIGSTELSIIHEWTIASLARSHKPSNSQVDNHKLLCLLLLRSVHSSTQNESWNLNACESEIHSQAHCQQPQHRSHYLSRCAAEGGPGGRGRPLIEHRAVIRVRVLALIRDRHPQERAQRLPPLLRVELEQPVLRHQRADPVVVRDKTRLRLLGGRIRPVELQVHPLRERLEVREPGDVERHGERECGVVRDAPDRGGEGLPPLGGVAEREDDFGFGVGGDEVFGVHHGWCVGGCLFVKEWCPRISSHFS